jgi:hypothetical protein
MDTTPKGSDPGFQEGFTAGCLFMCQEMIKALIEARDRLPSDPRVLETVNAIIRVIKEKVPEERTPPITTVKWEADQ